MKKQREIISADGTVIVGAPRVPFLRNVYHLFLKAPWWRALLSIVVVYLALNVVFGALYFFLGGVSNMREGSFFDAFVFSVQTIATIGYESMAPATVTANVLVIAEAVVGLLATAISTGLVFSKFTNAESMIRFASVVVVAQQNGAPTLILRLGNMRGNFIVEATARIHLIRTETTLEGENWYRLIDLPLQRDRTPALTRSWAVLHTIDEKSPLFGATPESLKKDEVELIVTLTGVDETSHQPVHARRRYVDNEIVFGKRYQDMVNVRGDGKVILDVSRFDDVVDDGARRVNDAARSTSPQTTGDGSPGSL